MLVRLFPGAEILILIGGVMAMFPIFYAVIENDLRRVLCYSKINQIGFMVVGVGIGTDLAIDGAIAHAFTHVLYKGLLFMSMGAVLFRTGEIRGSHLGGLYKSMPWTTGFCIVGAASISAFPLFSGFISKSIIITETARNGNMITWLCLLFASAGVFHHAGIKPDIVTVAKGIANGVPIGAVWAKLEVANAFQPGDHGSTFAGQPLAASAARETLRVLEEIKAPKLAKEKGAEMVSVITNIDGVNSVRGLGLLLGVEIEKDRLIHGDARDLAQACLREGLVVNGVTPTALRLAPPLTISSEEIIEGAGILEKVLKTRKEDAL